MARPVALTEGSSRPLRVGLATAAEVGELDDEGRLLADRLIAHGALAEPAVWDDPDVDWARFDVVVLRSTWDYAPRRGEFLAWAEHVAAVSRLENDLARVRWSTDKAYLLDLEAAGVPVVPSAFVEGPTTDHPFLGVEHVVKPSVSAGSQDTLRLAAGDSEASRTHLAAIHASGRTALVQPYLGAVDELGETALVYLRGEFSHAARKGPLLAPGGGLVPGLFAEEDISAVTATEDQLAVAARALAVAGTLAGAVAGPPLYARVDLLPDPARGPVLLELELAEPSLFLLLEPDAADRLARAILDDARSRPTGSG